MPRANLGQISYLVVQLFLSHAAETLDLASSVSALSRRTTFSDVDLQHLIGLWAPNSLHVLKYRLPLANPYKTIEYRIS